MEEAKQKWYFRKSILVLVFLSVGPLVLPLIWINPGFSRKLKITLTVVILLLSYLAVTMTMRFVSGLREEFQQIIQQSS
jgi:predicted Kef-type K+ transport protein